MSAMRTKESIEALAERAIEADHVNLVGIEPGLGNGWQLWFDIGGRWIAFTIVALASASDEELVAKIRSKLTDEALRS